MSDLPTHSGRPADRRYYWADQRGFALLITITLLAFLVLLLVSLASLTRVETQVASNSQHLAQARQNALMALNIALGQLQKYAGPDQRVTGTADLMGNNNENGGRIANNGTISTTAGNTKYWDTSATSNGLTTVRSGTRYWTGVWGNALPSAPTAGNQNIYETTPRPVLLNWLVSGNHNASFTAGANSGQVSAGTGLNHTPADTVLNGAATSLSGITTTATLVTAITNHTITLTPVAGGSAVPATILVGPATAGTGNANSRRVENVLNPATGAIVTPGQIENFHDRYVVAPLETITAPAGTVPGLNTASTIGRFAWWVGDEGVKARVNLVDRYAANTAPATDPLARARLLTVPRSGPEVVKDFPFTAAVGSTSNLADFGSAPTATNYASWSQSDGRAKNALRLPQFSLLDNTNLTAATTGRHFHDFTTASVGILADSYNGGLRHDLTHEFEKATLGTWTGTNGQTTGLANGILPAGYSPLMQTLSTPDLRVPRWDILHSFYTLPAAGNPIRLTGTTDDQLEIRPATADQMGIMPVLVKMRLMFGVAANATATPSTAVTPNLPGNTYRMLISPLIILANPYSVKLNTATGINLRFYDDSRTTDINHYRFGDGANRHKVFSAGGPLDGTLLHIPPFNLAPGAAAVFYVSGPRNATGTVELTQMTGTPPNASGFTDYLYRDYGNFTSSGGSIQFRAWETYNNSNVLIEFSLGTPGASQVLQLMGGMNPNRHSNDYPKRNIATNDPAAVANHAVCFYEWRYTTPSDNAPYAATAKPGVVHTTARGLADFNPRAGYYRVVTRNFGAAPFVQFYSPSNGSTASVLTDFKSNLLTPYWGRATTTDNNNTISKAVLFDAPRRPSNSAIPPIASLAAFQHANLAAENIPAAGSAFADEFGTWNPATHLPPNPGHQPAYILGNSYASSLVTRGKAIELGRLDLWANGNTPDVNTPRDYFDMSYLLNATLWDGYFLSTVPQSGSSADPVNPRYARLDTSLDVRDGAKAAAHIGINGAFNINSTSVDAWAALLGGMKNLPEIPGVNSTSTNAATVYPRSLWQPTAAQATPTGTEDASYSGYRQLSDVDVRNLATHIVQQVRLRGPFVSLGQFVNRVLVPPALDASLGLGQAGALQKAIDNSALNDFSGWTPTQDKGEIPNDGANPVGLVDDGSAVSDMGGRGTSYTYSDGVNVNSPTALRRSTGIPGWLTQADVLQAIGPVISARSDTFVIRTYGEKLDPISSTASTPVVLGRAWCEAVVQRLPEYMDTTADTPETAPRSATTTNQTFGRRFHVVSFRWLSPNDI